jgi:hypothetical protein
VLCASKKVRHVPKTDVVHDACRLSGYVLGRQATLLGPIGALGFYHRHVFLPVLTRAFADFSLLSLLSPKMRSQSLLEIPLNPKRKRSWCSSGFGFGVDVDVDLKADIL